MFVVQVQQVRVQSERSCTSLNSGQVVACPLFATTGAVVVDVLAQFIDG